MKLGWQAFALCIAFCAPIRAQWAIGPFVPSNDVSLTISTARKVHTVLEEITVSYRVLNISNHALYIPRTWMGPCPAIPQVLAWFEDDRGRHTILSYVGSCPRNLADSETSAIPAVLLAERMRKEAVLLEPNEYHDGSIALGTAAARGLTPGEYRIEATFSGWSEDRFSDAERADLPKLGNPLLRGTAAASMRISLTQ